MTVKIQVRRGTASAWTTANPTLSAGEMGFETDTLKIKIGDGTTAWSSLGYTTSGAAGYATTATAGGTTTFTVASAYAQFFTGSANQTVVLPVASTMTLGGSFYINNNSTGTLTVNSSGGNLVVSIPANTTVQITCILTSGTTAASWDADYTGATTITGTGSIVLSTSPTITTPTISGHATIEGVTPTGASGTGALLFGTGPSISNLTLTGTLTASASVGTNGYYLQTTGTGVQWAAVSGYSAPTLGSTSIGSGATVSTITGLTENNLTLTGSLTAGASTGTSGQVLTSTGSGVQWSAAASDATPTVFMLMGA